MEGLRAGSVQVVDALVLSSDYLSDVVEIDGENWVVTLDVTHTLDGSIVSYGVRACTFTTAVDTDTAHAPARPISRVAQLGRVYCAAEFLDVRLGLRCWFLLVTSSGAAAAKI